MKKAFKRALFLLLAVSMLCSGTVLSGEVFAADDPGIMPYGSDYITGYGGYCAAAGNGKVIIYYDLTGNGTQNFLGLKDIYLWESRDNGATWHIAKQFHWTDYPNMMGRMKFVFSSENVYYGTAGYKYYAEMNAWAGSSPTNGDLRTFYTGIITAT